MLHFAPIDSLIPDDILIRDSIRQEFNQLRKATIWIIRGDFLGEPNYTYTDLD